MFAKNKIYIDLCTKTCFYFSLLHQAGVQCLNVLGFFVCFLYLDDALWKGQNPHDSQIR